MERLLSPARTKESRVEQIWSIRRTNDKDIVAALALTHAIELREQLTDNSIHHAAGIALVAALRRDRVEFVEKDDTRLRVARALKHSSHVRFRFSDVHVEEFGSLDRKKVE